MAVFPALRNIDAFPVEQDGQTLICLSDPDGYVEEQLLLSPPAFFVAASLDGSKGVAEIQEEFARETGGGELPGDHVRQVVDFLGGHGFLLNARFQELYEATESAFRETNPRPAWMAGKSYPEAADELREYIDGFFTREGAPEAPPRDRNDTAAPLPGLIAPHIDFDRGGRCYAHSYHALAAGGRPETVILFGVAHSGAETPFIVTGKDFETPFGVLKNRRELTDRLIDCLDGGGAVWEGRHRTEHSLEFQAVMLAWRYGPDVRIVPVLCAMFSEDPAFNRPEELDEVNRFLAICRDYAADPANRVTVIAAADLAHVGRRFGDDFEINDGVVRAVRQRDDEDLASITECKGPEAFYRSVMRDANARKVCGLACIYSALKTLEGRITAADLLHYDYAHDPAGGIVSFAAMALR
jgi:MEMO1 family protein